MRGIPLSKERQALLLAAYRCGNREAVNKLVKEYNVSVGYPSLIARKSGCRKRLVTSQVKATSARLWKPAIANGKVIA